MSSDRTSAIDATRARLRWPTGRPRVLVTDAWLANAGDALIATALDELVRDLRPDAAVLHAAYQWDSVGPRIPTLACVPPLEHLVGTPWAPPAPGCLGLGDDLVASADLVVCQGGGFLMEDYEPRARLAALASVVRTGARLALLGISLGEFRDAGMRADLETIVRGAAVVVLRDDGSRRRALHAGAVAPLLSTDVALAKLLRQPVRPRGQGIGLVLTDHHASATRRSERAATAHRILVHALAATSDEPVHVWSTVQGLAEEAGEDDAAFARSLVASIPARDRARVRFHDGLVTPARAIELVRSTRALVTMRMHPALIAGGQGVPWALVLDDERSDLFTGTPMARRVVTARDPDEAVDAAIDRALALPGAPAAAIQREWDGVRARVGVHRDTLEAILPDAPTRRRTPVQHARHLVQRAAVSARVTGRSLLQTVPRRATGAVQGPTATATGLHLVWGWARVRGDSIRSILVTSDGEVVADATVAPPADDVVAALGAASDGAVSWSATVTFDQRRRARDVGALVVTRSGLVLPLTPLRVEVTVTSVGRVVTPSMSTVLSGPLRITGSALTDTPLARVEVAIDGEAAGRARLFSHDVDFTFATRALTGYEHVVAIGDDAIGRPVRITVTATTLDGQRHDAGDLAVWVRRAVQEEPATPRRVSGLTTGGARTPVAPTDSVATEVNTAVATSGRNERHDHRLRSVSHRAWRVAVLTHGLELGGAQLWLHEVLRDLRRDRAELLVVAGRDGPLHDELTSLGASVVVAPSVIDRPDGGPDGEIRGPVRAFEPDVVLANTVETAHGVSVALDLGAPTVWAIHEHLPVDQCWNYGSGTIDGTTTERFTALLRRTTRLVFVCEATRALFQRSLGPDAVLDVVPYGIPVDELDDWSREHPTARRDARHALGIGADRLLLVSVGTIEPRKGPGLLVAALAAGGATLEHVHVALVGDTGGAYSGSVRRLADELRVGARVHVLPSTREPQRWLLAADAFVMPSDLESMPRAAMEAMAAELPVVLGDVAGCSELLGEGGVVVPVRDVEELRDALVKLATAPEEHRRAIGRAARARVVARHGDLSYARRITELLTLASETPLTPEAWSREPIPLPRRQEALDRTSVNRTRQGTA